MFCYNRKKDEMLGLWGVWRLSQKLAILQISTKSTSNKKARQKFQHKLYFEAELYHMCIWHKPAKQESEKLSPYSS